MIEEILRITIFFTTILHHFYTSLLIMYMTMTIALHCLHIISTTYITHRSRTSLKEITKRGLHVSLHNWDLKETITRFSAEYFTKYLIAELQAEYELCYLLFTKFFIFVHICNFIKSKYINNFLTNIYEQIERNTLLLIDLYVQTECTVKVHCISRTYICRSSNAGDWVIDTWHMYQCA